MSSPVDIFIVDYGAGNLASIKNMLKKVGVHSEITNDPQQLEEAQKLILPGVGAFDHGMTGLNEGNFVEILNRKVLEEKIPVLGICLGMQLLSQKSEEGELGGLGWINSKTVKFDFSDLESAPKIPHMGWSDCKVSKTSALFEGLEDEARFYFVHSYHVQPEDESDILATSEYGFPFVASVEHENVLGVQFHPEKSHKFGMKLLENFAKKY